MMRVYVYGYDGGDAATPIVKACAETVSKTRGCTITTDLQHSDLAIAPLLTRFLTLHEIYTPHEGTLVFHPSLLPRHRGADAIKWAYKLNESYTGATWFWPDDGIDTGDICEQEVLAIPQGVAPRLFYEKSVIPAAVRMLDRILADVQRGVIRRIPQQHEHASYEPKIIKAIAGGG